MNSSSIRRSLPLAPKPLSTLHSFHHNYRVPVYLDEPHWGERSDLGAHMMSLCLEMDAAILASHVSDEQHIESEERKRRVMFQKWWPQKVSSLVEEMTERLRGTAFSDVEDYLRERGLGMVFPRVELSLQDPQQLLLPLDTSIIDSYMTKMSQLQMILSLAQQLSCDVQRCSSHKYIAHQTALLYQCLGQTGLFPEVRKDIEQHFNSVKEGSTAEPGRIPRLNTQIQDWIVTMCRHLQDRVVISIPLETKPITEVL